MPFETIHKDPAAFRVPPNLSSYEEQRANFSWGQARDCHPMPETLDLHALLAAVADDFEIVPTRAEDLELLHFTSGLPSGTPRQPHY